MGFLKRLFGGAEKSKSDYSDPDGIYLYVECDRCQTCVRVRADKRHDLNTSGDGYFWNKTIVDSRCFQRMTTVVHFDRKYAIVSAEIDGGHYITEEAYDAFLNPPPAPDPVVAESEFEAQPQTESEAQPQTESEAQPQTESEAQPQTESEAQPQTEAEADPSEAES